MNKRKRTADEEALLDKAYRYLPGGTVGNIYMPRESAFMIKEGKGSHLWDISGNEYIDYLLGSGPMVLGHAHPSVVAAVRDFLDRGSTYFITSEPAVLLAEEIVKAVPCAEKVRFASTGSEATLFAMRLARAYRKRDKILKFEGGFHGSNDYSVMSISGYGVNPDITRAFPRPTPGSAGVPKVLEDEVLIAPFNNLETTSAIIEKHHDELGGVIMEPFQRLLPPRPGFLEGVREVTAHYGIPLIFDEVVTGFRFSYGGAQEYYGVIPDLTLMAKMMGGGFPLSVICGKAEIMDHFDASRADTGDWVPQIGTLNGNPISCTAGLATLKELRKEGAYERLFATGKQLRDALERLLKEAEIPAQVIGVDCLFEVFFTDREITDYRSLQSADVAMLRRFNKLLLERGIFKSETKYYIGLCHTQEDVKKTIEAYAEAIDELKG